MIPEKNIAARPDAEFEAERLNMVAKQIRDRGIESPRVLQAMRSVERHRFVPTQLASRAYADEPLPIAAVISQLALEVIAVEAQPHLATSARDRLKRLGYSNIRVELGDGSMGWAAEAPYDAILVTAAAPAVPPPLIEQLAEGGRLVIPVGAEDQQELLRIVRHKGGLTQKSLYACRFVPLLGRYGWGQTSGATISG